MDEQTRRAQWKYDQETLEQSNRVQQAIEFKRMQEQQLQQTLAARHAGAVPSENIIATDIEALAVQ